MGARDRNPEAAIPMRRHGERDRNVVSAIAALLATALVSADLLPGPPGRLTAGSS